MPNKPTPPEPPDKTDFKDLNESLRSLSTDFEKFSGSFGDKPFAEENQENQRQLLETLKDLTTTVKSGSAQATKAIKGTGEFAATATSGIRKDVSMDKSTLAGRGASAINPLLGYALDSVLDSGAGQMASAKAKQGISAAGRALKNAAGKAIPKRKPSTTDLALSTKGEKVDEYARSGMLSSSSIDGALKPRSGRYARAMTAKAQEWKKSPDVVTAVDRLRLEGGVTAGDLPKAAIGGRVQTSGAAYVHEGEDIIPRNQVGNVSELYEVQESMLENLEEIRGAFVDKSGKGTGMFAQVGGAVKMFMGPLLSGLYAQDIPKSENPLITLASAAMVQYKWQRMYGELQRRQMNALLQFHTGKEVDMNVVGRRGAIQMFIKAGKDRFQKSSKQRTTELQEDLENSKGFWKKAKIRTQLAGQKAMRGGAGLAGFFNMDMEEYERSLYDSSLKKGDRAARSFGEAGQGGVSRNFTKSKRGEAFKSFLSSINPFATIKEQAVGDAKYPGSSLSYIKKKDGTKVLPSGDDMVDIARNKDQKFTIQHQMLISQNKSVKLLRNILKVNEVQLTDDQRKTIKDEKEKKKLAKQTKLSDRLQGMKEKGGGVLKAAGFVGKFLSTIGISGIMALGAIVTAMVAFPTKALDTIKWSFKAPEHFAKMSAIGYKLMKAMSGLFKLMTSGVKALFSSVFGKKVAKEVVEKGAKKGGIKVLSKLLGKKLLYSLPGIGMLAGIAFSIPRFAKGDMAGGFGELVSGGLSTFGPIGMVGSLLVDALLIAKDVKQFKKPKGKAGAIGKFFEGLFGFVFGTLKKIILGAVKGIGWIIKKTFTTYLKAVAFVWFGLPGMVLKMLGKMIGAVVEGGVKAVSAIIDAVKKIPDLFYSGIANLTIALVKSWHYVMFKLPGVLKESFKTLRVTVSDLLSKGWTKFVETASWAVQSGMNKFIDIVLSVFSHTLRKLPGGEKKYQDLRAAQSNMIVGQITANATVGGSRERYEKQKSNMNAVLASLITRHGGDTVAAVMKAVNHDVAITSNILNKAKNGDAEASKIESLMKEYGTETVSPLLLRGMSLKAIEKTLRGPSMASKAKDALSSLGDPSKRMANNNMRISELNDLIDSMGKGSTAGHRKMAVEYKKQKEALEQKNRILSGQVSDAKVDTKIVKALVATNPSVVTSVSHYKKSSSTKSRFLEAGGTQEQLRAIRGGSVHESSTSGGSAQMAQDTIVDQAINDSIVATKTAKKMNSVMQEMNESEGRINSNINNIVSKVVTSSVQNSNGGGNSQKDSSYWRSLDAITGGSAI